MRAVADARDTVPLRRWNQAKAEFRERLDDEVSLAAGLRKSSQFCDCSSDGVVAHCAAFPAGGDELLVRYGAAGRASEGNQYLHDARLDADFAAVSTRPTGRRADVQPSQAKVGFCGERDLHSRLSFRTHAASGKRLLLRLASVCVRVGNQGSPVEPTCLGLPRSPKSEISQQKIGRKSCVAHGARRLCCRRCGWFVPASNGASHNEKSTRSHFGGISSYHQWL